MSTSISLPEKADVLVSEVIGNEPLAERVLEVTADALKRLLKPEARLVPSALRIFGLPVVLPRSEILKRTVVPESLEKWKSWYGIDFGPLGNAEPESQKAFHCNPYLAREWKRVAPAAVLAEFNLRQVGSLGIDTSTDIVAEETGRVEAVLVYFELDLGPSTRLSTSPSEVEGSNHWESPVWILPRAIPVKRGDRMTVRYQYRTAKARHRMSVSLNDSTNRASGERSCLADGS